MIRVANVNTCDEHERSSCAVHANQCSHAAHANQSFVSKTSYSRFEGIVKEYADEYNLMEYIM